MVKLLSCGKNTKTWFAGEINIKVAARPDKTCLVKTLLGRSSEHFNWDFLDTPLHCIQTKIVEYKNKNLGFKNKTTTINNWYNSRNEKEKERIWFVTYDDEWEEEMKYSKVDEVMILEKSLPWLCFITCLLCCVVLHITLWSFYYCSGFHDTKDLLETSLFNGPMIEAGPVSLSEFHFSKDSAIYTTYFRYEDC
jgi:hypothetical protein